MTDDAIQEEWKRLVKRSHKGNAAPHPPSPPTLPYGNKRKRTLSILVLLIVSVVLCQAYFWGPLNPWPDEPTSDEMEAGWQTSMLLAAEAIRDYAAFHGQYPEKLEDAIQLSVTIEYVLTTDGFELRLVNTDGNNIVVRAK